MQTSDEINANLKCAVFLLKNIELGLDIERVLIFYYVIKLIDCMIIFIKMN
jgi:hypothetical protein